MVILKPPYPDKFKPGDITISKWNNEFMDGTKHIIGQRIEITERNVHYYNVHHEYYDHEHARNPQSN